MRLALKIDVDTLRGTLHGVPALADLLQRHQVGATFLFSLGPDRTGRAIRRVFRPGFFNKVSRTSVLRHYGLRTMMYGTLLPAPDIGRRTAVIMRRVAQLGFETGVHCWDHTTWQDFVARSDEEWARRQMRLAVDRYAEIFGAAPGVHGAAGWQMNSAAFELERSMGFRYASDTRGSSPFVPVMPRAGGKGRECLVQLPTTLPTLDELIGIDGIGEDEVHQVLLRRTAEDQRDHVFTLHAELEGMQLLPVMHRLLAGWRNQGYEFVKMETMFDSLNLPSLPRCSVVDGSVPGRSGSLAVQGAGL